MSSESYPSEVTSWAGTVGRWRTANNGRLASYLWPATFAALFGIRAAFFIYGLNSRLIPDSGEYARGTAAWSSSVGAGIGMLGGMPALRVFGVVSALVLGGYLGGTRPKWALGIMLTPPGWYTVQAAVDAAGAFAACLYAKKWWSANLHPRASLYWFLLVPAIATVHLVAGLVVAVFLIGARMAIPPAALAIVSGCGACLGEHHFQARYFLPGLCILAVVKA